MGMGFEFEQHRLGLWDLSWDLKRTISWEMGLGPPLHDPLLLHNLQLIHEVITEDTPCSSCAKNQTAGDHSSGTAGNTEPILQRLTNLVELVKQSTVGCTEGEV